LTLQLLILVITGFLCAAAVTAPLFYWSADKINIYLWTSDYIIRCETPLVEKFQAYIDDGNIASSDNIAIIDWVRAENIYHLTIVKDGYVIYDSAYPNYFSVNQTYAGNYNNTWMYFLPVKFCDLDAEVYIDNNFALRFFVLVSLGIAALGLVLWALWIILGTRRNILFIGRLNLAIGKIKEGDLESILQWPRTDELGVLASGLDDMRAALLAKSNSEAELKAAQDKLVVGMAHDLRTPLTGLIAYMEIARQQDSLTESDPYITKALDKAGQIRDLSDQLFEFFLVHSDTPMELSEPEEAEYVLGEYLSELCELLSGSGYTIRVDNLIWKPVRVRISTDYVWRIIDNLVSNIRKYADPNEPVCLSSSYTPDSICISVANRIKEPNPVSHGSGIGTKNIETMMKKMGGSCRSRTALGRYAMELRFPAE